MSEETSVSKSQIDSLLDYVDTLEDDAELGRQYKKSLTEEVVRPVSYTHLMSTKGFAFSEDSDMQRDFEMRFEYDETVDQLRCSEEIKHDMERCV